MAEAAQTVPTFKLVLVGDGGTGKVCYIESCQDDAAGLLDATPHGPHSSRGRVFGFDIKELTTE